MRIGFILKKFTCSSMHTRLRAARILIALLWGSLFLSVLAAPLLSAHGGEPAAMLLYFFFSPVCHQIPERSFLLSGHAWAVCHRCAGLYLGLFAAALLDHPLIRRRPDQRRAWVLAAAIPLLLDALLPYAGFWDGTAFSRFATGLFFGYVSSSLLVLGVTEWLRETPRRCFRPVIRVSREVFHE
jgi:uncharacterized membrane protein